MPNVTFGSNASDASFTDQDIYQDPGVVDIAARRLAANGQGPQIITHLLGYCAGAYSTARSVKMQLGSSYVTFTTPAGSASASTGYKDSTDWYIANGTNNAVFGYYNSSGSIYAGRSTSGGTVMYGTTARTGVLGGAYTYIQVPVAPSTPSGTTGPAGQVTISWTAPSDDGGSAVTGYRLRYSTDSTFATGVTNVDLGVTTTWTGTLLPGVAYYFQVAAKNAVTTAASTTSVFSSTSSAVTPKGSPKTWNGYAWTYSQTNVWNGTAWVVAPTNVWNGTEWTGAN